MALAASDCRDKWYFVTVSVTVSASVSLSIGVVCRLAAECPCASVV